MLLCAVVPSTAGGAEVAGTVGVAHQGLFDADASVQSHPISVALFPAEGQAPSPRESVDHEIDILEHRMRPAFSSIQLGARVTFVNHDPVFHQLFSLSQTAPISVQLAKADDPDGRRVTIRPEQPGTTHIFCRIHSKSYARIDVLDTPYFDTVQAGGRFHFSGLAPGRWKLRLASPGAETKWTEVVALTEPPEKRFTLISYDGGWAPDRVQNHARVEQLYQE
jgi:plastocyanin